MRRAGFLGHHPPRDKEHHRASAPAAARNSPAINRRTPYLAAPATADIIIGPNRPSSIDRPQPQSLKWNRRWQQRQQVSFGARPR
jgi:hypothetical protein